MCAIVGFIAKQDSGPNLERLRKVIRANHSRGEHAHGMVWIDGNGRVNVYKRPGAFQDNLHVLEAVQSARVVICHLRKTTQGHHDDNINNHPHPCDAGWYIHNGSIRNYQDLVTEWGLMVSSQCDSEALGLLTSRFNYGKLNQWQQTINQVDRHDALSVMAVYERPSRLIVGRRGKPLQWWKGSEGLYFASLGAGLPKSGKEFKDNQVVEYRWTRDKGGYRYAAQAVDPYIAPVRAVPRFSIFDGSGRGKSLSHSENALLSAELDYRKNGAQSGTLYVPAKYRMQQQIERDLEIVRRAGKKAKKLRKKAKKLGKQSGCIDGMEFHFEGDQFIVDGPCQDPSCSCREEVPVDTCPHCDCHVFSSPYPDGHYCDCHYMDGVMTGEYEKEAKDAESSADVITCDNEQLDRLEGKS